MLNDSSNWYEYFIESENACVGCNVDYHFTKKEGCVVTMPTLPGLVARDFVIVTFAKNVERQLTKKGRNSVVHLTSSCIHRHFQIYGLINKQITLIFISGVHLTSLCPIDLSVCLNKHKISALRPVYCNLDKNVNFSFTFIKIAL